MAKRFTDTDKWKREWFSNLDTKAKLAWFYLLDQCDHSGIWPRNFKMMSQDLGFKVDHEMIMTWFVTKIIHFDADKYYIPSFLFFQYGSKKTDFKARVHAVEKLKSLGLLDENENVKKSITQVSLKEELPNPSEQLPNCLSNSNSNSNSKFERESERKLSSEIGELEFDAFYQKYPKKKGKILGRQRFFSRIKTKFDLDQIHMALDRYVSDLSKNSTDKQYIKEFGTWMGTWEECLDENYGEAMSFKKNQNFQRGFANEI